MEFNNIGLGCKGRRRTEQAYLLNGSAESSKNPKQRRCAFSAARRRDWCPIPRVDKDFLQTMCDREWRSPTNCSMAPRVQRDDARQSKGGSGSKRSLADFCKKRLLQRRHGVHLNELAMRWVCHLEGRARRPTSLAATMTRPAKIRTAEMPDQRVKTRADIEIRPAGRRVLPLNQGRSGPCNFGCNTDSRRANRYC